MFLIKKGVSDERSRRMNALLQFQTNIMKTKFLICLMSYLEQTQSVWALEPAASQGTQPSCSDRG